MTTGELYGKPLPSTDKGTCYICGQATEHGWREAPSGKFTAWAQCFAGDVHCEHCRSLLKDNRFRFYCWVLTPGGLEVKDKEHRGLLWDTLQDPPRGPWALYQTRSGQKQGWIPAAAAVNESRTTFRVATDWLDKPIMMRLGYVQEHAPVIDRLRAVEVTLDSLRSGSWSMLDYKRAAEANLEADYNVAYKQAGKPEWEVMVNAHHAG